MADYLNSYVRVFQMGGRSPALQMMLLNCNESDFDQSVKGLKQQAIMQMITSLQSEMRSEQSNFDRLTRQLSYIPDKTSRQYKAISADLMSSQARLTSLMNKSMKCYNLQSAKLSASSSPDVRKENGGFIKPTKQTNDVTDSRETRIRPSKSVENFAQPENDVGQSNSRVKQRPSIQDLRKMFDAEENLKRTNQNLIENVKKSNKNVHLIKFNNSSTDLNTNNSNSKGVLYASKPVLKSESQPENKNVNLLFKSQTTKLNDFPAKITVNSTPADDKKTGVKPTPLVAKSSFTVKLNSPLAKPTDNRTIPSNKSNNEEKIVCKSALNSNMKIVSPIGKNINDEKIGSNSNTIENKNKASYIKKQDVCSDDPAINSELMAALADLKKCRVSSSQSVKNDAPVWGDKKEAFVSKTAVVSLERESKVQATTEKPKNETKSTPKTKNDVKVTSLSQVKLTSRPKSSDEVTSPITQTNNTTTNASIKSSTAAVTSLNKTPTVAVTSLNKTPTVAVTSLNKTPEVAVTSLNKTPTVMVTSPNETTQTITVTSPNETVADDDDLVQPRVYLTQWDPVKLLNALYKVELKQEIGPDLSQQMVTMEGFMEKLPMGKKKSTLLKTWKRRYFKTYEGMLHYYESSKGGQPSMSVKLMGGKVESLDNRILGIEDASGHYLMLRCPTEREFTDWKRALESQTVDNSCSIYVRPVLKSPHHPSKKIVIVDIGSCNIRAGILGEKPSLPTLFFPTVVAVNKTTNERVVGFDAYRPDVRSKSDLIFPVRPSRNAERDNSWDLTFTINIECLAAIFTKIFAELSVDSSQFTLLISTPQNFSNQIKERVLDMLVKQFKTPAICMVPQALLAMYSYKVTSGVIVDMGERLEIMAITDGYVVEGGVTRKAYGAEKVRDSLTASLTECCYHLYSPVENLITRYVLEQSCYVSSNYDECSKDCLQNRVKYERCVPLADFNLPAETYTEIKHNESTFKSCEGFFNPSLWGADFPTLQSLIHKAIQTCPLDTRRDMARSIYLSGGSSMAVGFSERLTQELVALVPQNLKVIVHAAPQRYHAAFIGAGNLADQKFFEPSCITREEWLKNGPQTLKKWATPS